MKSRRVTRRNSFAKSEGVDLQSFVKLSSFFFSSWEFCKFRFQHEAAREGRSLDVAFHCYLQISPETMSLVRTCCAVGIFHLVYPHWGDRLDVYRFKGSQRSLRRRSCRLVGSRWGLVQLLREGSLVFCCCLGFWMALTMKNTKPPMKYFENFEVVGL